MDFTLLSNFRQTLLLPAWRLGLLVAGICFYRKNYQSQVNHSVPGIIARQSGSLQGRSGDRSCRHKSSEPSARLLNRPERSGNNLINACRTSIVATEGQETRWEGTWQAGRTLPGGWPADQRTINAFTGNCWATALYTTQTDRLAANVDNSSPSLKTAGTSVRDFLTRQRNSPTARRTSSSTRTLYS